MRALGVDCGYETRMIRLAPGNFGKGRQLRRRPEGRGNRQPEACPTGRVRDWIAGQCAEEIGEKLDRGLLALADGGPTATGHAQSAPTARREPLNRYIVDRRMSALLHSDA